MDWCSWTGYIISLNSKVNIKIYQIESNVADLGKVSFKAIPNEWHTYES